MRLYQAADIRNVGLFGHGGAGKTSLSEALLYNAGVITRLGRVDDGTTTSDYDPEEIKRHISVQLSLLPFEWKGRKINLIDVPGYADFVGEVRAALRVVDSAIIVVDAVAGAEVGTELVWQYADDGRLPRVIFINKIDRENADFDRTLDHLRERFGNGLLPLQLPLGQQDRFRGVVDLVQQCAYLEARSEPQPIPSEMAERVAALRERLIEAAAEADDDLITKYLDGGELTAEEIVRGLRAGIQAGRVVPVLVGSALLNRGVSPLLDLIVEYLPSPADRGPVAATDLVTQKSVTLPPDPHGPLAALIFKTTADPFVGRLNYFRVYSGTFHADSHVWNASKGREERVGTLFLLRGKHQEPVGQVVAGDIGAVAKLQETATGDTLCSRDRLLLLPGITFPTPVFCLAAYPKTKADLEKMGSGLHRLVEEDPTLAVRREPDTGETLLCGLGESHVEIAAEKLRRKFGVEVVLQTPKVPYKETIQTTARAEYKHKKQTGGRGQYGHVFLELEPLPRGAGFEFAERIVGGVVPKQYIPAVEKGVREAMAEGNLAGFPVVDVKVTLYDGSHHPVDSSEISFQIAAAHAFRKGFDQARPVLLEPIMNVTIRVPDQYVGDILSDLNTKRGRVLGMEPEGGVTVIRAQAPLAEMQRYATVLRSLTQGRGTYTMEFDHYEEVPPHISQQVIEQARKERAAARED